MSKVRYNYRIDGTEDWQFFEVTEDEYDWDYAYETLSGAKKAAAKEAREKAGDWAHLAKAIASITEKDVYKSEDNF